MKILSRLSLLILLLFWAGCSTMPSGGAKEKASLLVVLADLEDSPGSVSLSSAEDHFSVKFADDGIGFVKVAPGPVTGQGGALANIPENAVVLYPVVISRNGVSRALRPADQQRAMNALTEYVGFETWFGGEYVNFGPYRPKQYLSGEYFPLIVDSSPEGGVISIDNIVWGETPQVLELTAGKYLVEVSAPGYRSYKRIVTLDQPLTVSPELEPLDEETGIKKESFRIMIAPISPFTSGDDPYGDVIRSTMEVNFGADERLEVVPSYSAIQKGLYPDFNPAEQAGADLLVAGHYDMEGPDLYLEVVLYETASRRVRYAETYLTEAGFAVFDSIDDVSRRFVEAVGRTLPEAGEPIVEKEVAVSDELVTFEQSIFKKRMIDSRTSRRNLLSAKIGFGGLGDEMDDGLGNSVHFSSASVLSTVTVEYQRILSDFISFASIFTVFIQTVEADGSSAVDIVPNYSVTVGPEFTFRSETSDVYFTPGVLLGFTPGFTAFTTQDVDYSPQFYTGLELDVGYRYYFFRKRKDIPVFMNLGMMFDLIEMAFGEGQDFRIVPIRGSLYLGGGVAL